MHNTTAHVYFSHSARIEIYTILYPVMVYSMAANSKNASIGMIKTAIISIC